ncbi:MAG: choice-of-anchor L domain-containing protein [Chitinophagales bacterium]|nr:choice-of-anchor L domain-containing protein [Chitinophagales bacterium]
MANCMVVPSVFAQLNVTPSVTPEELIETLVGQGVNVSNVVIDCPDLAYGTFDGEFTTLPIASGIVLTSGDAIGAIGPNDIGSYTGVPGTGGPGGDPDLEAITGGAINDACILEFDFVPFSDELTFNYVFGSDEYLEWVGQFNDVFAFLISGPNPAGGNYNNVNIALVPGSSTPVSINNINLDSNSTYYIDNGDGGTVDPESTIQYDGLTTMLTASANVIPCQTYHLKIAIGDAIDSAYDSGVFLQAGSLSTNFVSVSANALSLTGDAETAIEGCVNAQITFEASEPVSEDLVINFDLAGSATEGLDYEAIPHTITIPAGDSIATMPITILEDNTSEGIENLIVSFSLIVACSQFDQSAELEINDVTPVNILNDDVTIDPGQLVQLQATGGSGNYTWSPTTGLNLGTIPNPVAAPLTTTTYTVSSVVGSCTLTDAMTITVFTCDPATQVVAGNSQLSDNIVCAGASLTATATGGALFAGDVVGFAIHANADDDLIGNPNSILALTTGGFTNDGTFAYNTPYYITPIAADNNGNGLPDLNDECLSVGASAIVTFLSPVVITINEDCDWSIGDYTVTTLVSGGYGALEPNSTYALSGTVNGTVNPNESVSIVFTSSQTPNSYTYTAVDEQGCSTTRAADFPICLKTPIELLSFSGEVKTDGNLLKWATASETDNNFFTVERSVDGNNFIAVGRVDGAGTSFATLNYQFLDQAAPNSMAYYRLSQTDYNGKSTTSNTISLMRERASMGFGIVQVFPVPITETVNVAINTLKAGAVNLQLFNATGQLVWQQNTNCVSGYNTHTIDFPYSSGVYLLTVNNGKEIVSTKLVKE